MLIDGVSSDLSPPEVRSWPDLRTYCIQVASSVGLAMCHLLRAGDNPLARHAAVELGIAMQLTNIVRDVGADLRVGRVYLPSEDLAAHGYSRERLVWLAARVKTHGPSAIDEPFRDLMRAQIARARDHYARGLDGVRRLPPENRLAILLAGRLYQAILEAIESADYDVFSRRAATSLWLKVAEAARWSITLRLPEQSTPQAPRPHVPALGVAADSAFLAWSAEAYDSANDLAVVTR
jgi:phytoene synthase